MVRNKFRANKPNKIINKNRRFNKNLLKSKKKNISTRVTSKKYIKKSQQMIYIIKKNESFFRKRLFNSNTLEFLKREHLRRYYLMLAEKRHKNWFNIILNRNRSSKRKLSVFFKFFCDGTRTGSTYFYKLFRSRFFSSYNTNSLPASNLVNINSIRFNYKFIFNNYFSSNKARCIFFNSTKDFYFMNLPCKHILQSRYFLSSFVHLLFKKKF